MGGDRDAGALNVLHGHKEGLTATLVPDQQLDQDSDGIGDEAERSDNFGLALAAGRFNGDASDDLAVGVPFEDIFDIVEAGAMNVIPGASLGAEPIDEQFWHQDR